MILKTAIIITRPLYLSSITSIEATSCIDALRTYRYDNSSCTNDVSRPFRVDWNKNLAGYTGDVVLIYLIFIGKGRVPP